MKTKLIFSLLVGALLLSAFSCNKKDTTPVEGNVDLYLLTSFETIGDYYKIDETTIVLSDGPLIEYDDLLTYNSSEYSFELSDNAIGIINSMEHQVHGIAFAIKANDEVVYTGYFWPGFSSASCDWVVVDPITVTTQGRIDVKLGYPHLLQGQTIEDRRNDDRITRIFQRDGKLRE